MYKSSRPLSPMSYAIQQAALWPILNSKNPNLIPVKTEPATPGFGQQKTFEPFTYPELPKLDLSRPLSEQRPVLKRSRLRRDFTPNRERVDYSYVRDNKERRRLRSQDNARLYRDREKQKIMDLEQNIEKLMTENSQLTIQHTTLNYKYEILKKYIEENAAAAQNQVPPPVSKRMALNDSTQIREGNEGSMVSSSTIENNYIANSLDFAASRIGINDNSEICAILKDNSREKNQKVRNPKNLSLLINDSNKTASSGASQQTVIDTQFNVATSQVSFDTTAEIGEPIHTSSKIMSMDDQKTPLSCYGSAEPSPADDFKMQNHAYQTIQQQLQQVQTRFPF